MEQRGIISPTKVLW